MMTSVTLPSNTGTMRGAYSPTVPEDPPMSGHDFEAPRPVKRCLSTPLSDNCKKRRKQSTPVRISATDSPPEGKPVPSPEPESRCPICQVVFATQDLLQSHMSSEHSNFECKQEPCDSPSALDNLDNQDATSSPEQLITKPDISWMSEMGKDWMGSNLLPYPTTSHMFMGVSQLTPDAIAPRQPIRIFNPDAYCELCNKEFCNKYFLKTHKANKHGIYSDPPAASEAAGLGSSVNIPSYVSNMKIPNSVPSVDISTVKIEPKPQLMQSYPDLFPNPFTSKLFPKSVKSAYDMENPENGSANDTVSANDQEESPSPRAPLLEPPTSMKQENLDQDVFYAALSKFSPGQQSRELDLSIRLRRIGVMNPKAFCEICCKEYCNKYFLRTHKMKRHGIYIPDDREKDMKVDSMGVHYVQTSPLNLIMAEQQATNSSIDRKTSSPSEISCETCGIKFQNMSLFQLHNVSVHSKMPTNNQEATTGEKKQSEQFDKAGNSSDSISEDLKKLQTMILQLNDLDVSKISSTCTTCNKEFENRYYLHAHMMTEHGLLLDDNCDSEKPGEAGDAATVNNNTMCDLCGKDFQNYDDMKKHIIESHGTPAQSSETKEQDSNNGPTTSDKGPIRAPITPVIERRATMNLTPTSSYCEICNKELCNKYFMKTHMQRMHGIEIENGAQIGGVICDICNKELCSKYFLRVHKHNTHGIVEYGSGLMHPRKGEEAAPPMPVEPDNALKPTDLADLSHRYFTHFTEVCTICSRRFRSTKWLKAHLLNDHGQAGAEKWAEMEQQMQPTINQASKSSTSTMKMPQGDRISPTLKIPTNVESSNQQKMGLQNVLSSILGADAESTSKTYHCSYCPFTTPVLPFLFVHERSHSLQSIDGELKCPVCSQSFQQPELLQHHIYTQHPFLPLPPFFNGNTESQGEVSKEPSESAEENEDAGALSDMSKQQPQQQQQQQHMKMKSKVGGVKRKPFFRPDGMSAETDQVLKEAVKKLHVPATYAIPQPNADDTNYVMQAFLVEENNSTEHNSPKIVPSVVFLPVSQKISSPVTATFTLTPA